MQNFLKRYIDLLNGPFQILSLCICRDLKVMPMKGYYTHPRASEMESHHSILFNVIPRIPLFRKEKLTLSALDTLRVFWPWQQGIYITVYTLFTLDRNK